MSHIIVRGDHRKNIKVITVWHVKCVFVTGITKGIVMAHNNRCLLVRYGDYR